MPRAGAGRDRDEGRVAGGELGVLDIEAVDGNLVEAEVRDESKATGWINDGLVRMRCFLPLPVDAGAGVLDDGGVRREFSRFDVERQDGDVAAAVVGGDQTAAGGIERKVAGSASAGAGVGELSER